MLSSCVLQWQRFSIDRSSLGLFVLAFALSTFSGCSKEEEVFRKETSVVTGQVLVDGVPVPVANPLKVECHNVAGMDQEHPTISTALTSEDGKFEISTYESGDGLPPGNYVLTFMWGKFNPLSGSYGGPDKLKRKYLNPETSEFKLTVKEGEPVELGEIKLVTK